MIKNKYAKKEKSILEIIKNSINFLCSNINASNECVSDDKKCELVNGQYYAYNCDYGAWTNQILCPNGCNSTNRECALPSTPAYINIESSVSSGFNNIVEICGVREGVATRSKGVCLQRLMVG
jgi:hypothetical protein